MTVPSSSPEATLIDGRAISEEILAGIKSAVESSSIIPGLAVVLVGSDPASSVYVRNKSARAKDCGFQSYQVNLPPDTGEYELISVISELNSDASVHGILVQLPLPPHIDQKKVIEAIDPEKDVDGFHYVNAGKLAVGDSDGAFIPCTPLGVMVLLKRAIGSNLSGKHAVVVGRSNIVGKPVAALLLAENCSVSIVHSKTIAPESICRHADIVIAAVGVPRLVTADWVKAGAVVIDVGINRVIDDSGKSQLVGDVDFECVRQTAAAITPVPGGVGPMTIAMLLRNTLDSAIRTGARAAQSSGSPS
ncbi:bifunctional 5,10-methylenetetrahydrofolate dehydrogenase/5,10-methenyltetrahydrofolate cyclohydrolase [Caballeronia sp. DA-9]|uniref:bifunctional 5,10-methylenetetrahydrofolate dehydrogenase/5,10-methenyltetrahydrofolate cyclohydrolase n=1 Tax=Caballeronia sp. DA-9 TaxID=3436237 RepID=UPI003F667934